MKRMIRTFHLTFWSFHWFGHFASSRQLHWLFDPLIGSQYVKFLAQSTVERSKYFLGEVAKHLSCYFHLESISLIFFMKVITDFFWWLITWRFCIRYYLIFRTTSVLSASPKVEIPLLLCFEHKKAFK